MPLRKPIFGLIALHQFLHARQQFFQTKSNVFELLYLDIFVCCESKKKKIEHDKKEMKGIIEMEMRNLMTKLFFRNIFNYTTHLQLQNSLALLLLEHNLDLNVVEQFCCINLSAFGLRDRLLLCFGQDVTIVDRSHVHQLHTRQFALD
jgi:hypothetical protein